MNSAVAVVISGEAVLWVALCRCDSRGGRGMGSAVPLRLAGRAWYGVALCRWDWRGERGVGSAVPLGVHSVAELAWLGVA